MIEEYLHRSPGQRVTVAGVGGGVASPPTWQTYEFVAEQWMFFQNPSLEL